MRLSPLIRRIVQISVTAVMAAAGVLVLAAPAHATVGDMVCAGSESVSWSPALTNSPQSTTVTANRLYGPCTSLSVPGITSGSVSATIPTTSSCVSLLSSRPVSFTITWNTGQTSTVSGNAAANIAAAVLTVTITGIVAGGVFTGDAVVQTVVAPATDILLCTLGLGTLSNMYGVVALTFV